MSQDNLLEGILHVMPSPEFNNSEKFITRCINENFRYLPLITDFFLTWIFEELPKLSCSSVVDIFLIHS